VIPAPFAWFESAAAHDLGRVLLHTLWQAPLAAAALWGALKTLPAARAQARCAAGVGAMLTVVIAAFFTHAVITQASTSESPTPISVIPAQAGMQSPRLDAHENVSPIANPTPRVRSLTVAARPVLTLPSLALTAWAAIATLLLLNTLRSVLATRRLTRGPGVKPVDPGAQDVLQDLQKRLHIRRAVRLLTSAAAHTPCVLGAMFPVIVLPPALAAGLTPDQLRVVLAHELAHIRRHDYLINLLQRLVEALLFFNPAVWWISRQLRVEREAACDAIAASALDDDRVHVARTLVDVLQQLSPAPPPTTAMALGQPHQERPLTTRIQRLLHPHLPDAVRLPWPTLLLALLLTAATLYGVACGTESAAVAIDKIVNPEKYVDDTRELVASQPVRNATPSPEERPTLRGTVVAHDGASLDGRETSLVLVGHGVNTMSLRSDPDDPTRLIFDAPGYASADARLLARVAGYGPVASDELELKPGRTTDGIRLVLPPARDLPVRITDPDGQPIDNVQFEYVSATISQSGTTGGQHLRLDDLSTDVNGRMILPDTGPIQYRGVVETPGYERLVTTLTPAAGDTWDITLHPALPVTGRVIDARSGDPVAGARIFLAWDGTSNPATDHRQTHHRTEQPRATTDADGRFALTSLTRGARQTLYIEADDHSPMILRDVTPAADTEPLSIALSPAIRPRIRVLGDIDRLPVDQRGNPTLRLEQTVRYQPNSSFSTSFEAKPLPDDPTLFVFDRAALLDGEAFLTAGPLQSVLTDLRDDANDVITLDFSRAPPVREVVLKLAPPAGWPVPEGTAKLRYHADPKERWSSIVELPIENGTVRFTVPLDRGMAPKQPAKFTLLSVEAPGYYLPVPTAHGEDDTPVPAGDGPLAIARVILPAGVVTGQVTDAQGRPLADARLSLQIIDAPADGKPDANALYDFDADNQGRFIISPAPFGGTYRVRASSSAVGRFAGGQSELFTVTADQPRPDLAVTIPRGTDVTLTVRDPEGDPVPHAPVDLSRNRTVGGNGWKPPEYTDAHGVVVLHHLDLEDADSTWSALIGPTSELRPQRVTIDTHTVAVSLEPGFTLRGRLLNAVTREPMAHRQVVANVASYKSSHEPLVDQTDPIETDADGTVVFTGLEPGFPYLLRAHWSKDWAEPATLAAQQSGKPKINLTRATRIEFTEDGPRTRTLELLVVPQNGPQEAAPAAYVPYGEAPDTARQQADSELAAIHRAIMADPPDNPEAAARVRESLVQEIERYLQTHPDTPFKPELLYWLARQFRSPQTAPADEARWLNYATEADRLYGDRFSAKGASNRSHLANHGHHDDRVAYFLWMARFHEGQATPEEFHPVRNISAVVKHGQSIHYTPRMLQELRLDLRKDADLSLNATAQWVVRMATPAQLHDLVTQHPGTRLAETAAARLARQR